MKKTILVFLFLLMGSHSFAVTQGFNGFEKNQTSMSFFAGQPVFFRYNKFIGWKRAWSVDGGYHFDKYLYLAGNYTVYFYNIKDRLKNEENFFNSLLFYAGPGVFFGPDFGEEKSDEKVKIGVRLFGGVEYIFKDSPWSLNAEVGPAFYIEGDEDFVGFQGMLGITHYIGGIKKRKIKSRTTIVQDNTREVPVRRSKSKKVESKPQAEPQSQEQGDTSEFEEFEE